MNYIKKIIFIVCTLAGLFTLTGCPKSSSSSKPEEAKKISGKITDENGTALPNVEVKVDGKVVFTDNSGAYTVDNLSGKSQYQITVTSKEHFPGYKNVENIDNSEIFADVMLLTKQKLQTFDSQTGGTISSNDGIEYVVNPDAFKLNGQNYNGKVETSTKYIDASQQDVIATAMPGGDFAATNAQGENGSMVSFGFFATEFTTANGQKLDINPNAVKARITLPTNAPDPSQNNASLWVFNTSTNTWNSGGSVERNGNEITMPVTTFTFSNLDAFQGKAVIKGTVTDCDGKKAAGIEVKVTGYSNSKKIISYTSKTNGNGNYLFKNVAAPSKSMPLSYKVEVKSKTKEIVDIKANDIKTLNFDLCQSKEDLGCFYNYEINVNGEQFNAKVCNGEAIGKPGFTKNCDDTYTFGIADFPTLNLLMSAPSKSGTYNFKDDFTNTCNTISMDVIYKDDQYTNASGTVKVDGNGNWTVNATLTYENKKITVTGNFYVSPKIQNPI
jgi:hypothetical protein